MNSVTDDNRSTEYRETTDDQTISASTLEAQINEKRASIGRTLGQLENKLSPKQIMNEGIELFQEHGGDVAGNLGRSFRDNPAPFLVAGVGIAWLMAATSSRSGANTRRDVESDYYSGSDYRGIYSGDRHRASSRYDQGGMERSNSMPDQAGPASDNADTESTRDGFLEQTADALSGAVDKGSEYANELQGKMEQGQRVAEEHLQRAQEESQKHIRSMRRKGHGLGVKAQSQAGDVTQYLKDQPLVSGALGIAIGALIGSLLPSTQMEDNLMGEHADTLKNQTADKAAQGAEKAREKVERLSKSARSEIKNKLEDVAQTSPELQTES